MSSTDWIKMERPEEDTYVYDQHCMNCRFYYRDECGGKTSKHPTCHNPESDYYNRHSPTKWCWAWKKGKRPYRSDDNGGMQEVAADA